MVGIVRAGTCKDVVTFIHKLEACLIAQHGVSIGFDAMGSR